MINLGNDRKGWFLKIRRRYDDNPSYLGFDIFSGPGIDEYVELKFKNMIDSNNKELNGELQENILYQLDISYSNREYEFRLIYDIKYNAEGNYFGKLTDKISLKVDNNLITDGYITVGSRIYSNNIIDTFTGKIYAISLINNSSLENEGTFMLPKQSTLNPITTTTTMPPTTMPPTTTRLPTRIIPYTTKTSFYKIENPNGIILTNYKNISNDTFGLKKAAWKMSILFNFRPNRSNNQLIVSNMTNVRSTNRGWSLGIDFDNDRIIFVISRFEGRTEFYPLTFSNMRGLNNTELNGSLQENVLYQLDVSYINKSYRFRLIYDLIYNDDGNYYGNITDTILEEKINPFLTTSGSIEVGGFDADTTFRGNIYALTVIDNSVPETNATFLLPQSSQSIIQPIQITI